MPQPDDVDIEEYLQECANIDPLEIQEAYLKVPAELAYWNARYAKALRRAMMKKVDVDLLEAQLDPLMRKALKDAGANVTESIVKATIAQNESLIEARRELVDADVEKAQVFGALDAIRSKKEMLISLGAHLRAEMQGDPTIREHARASRMVGG